MNMKEESEKAGLKLNRKPKTMTSSPITSWQIEGEKVEAMTDFIFLDSKITVNSDCSHEMERHLFLGRRAMINLDSVLKNRDITLLTKCPYSQSYGFPSSHVMDVKDKEGWVLKNWCFQIGARQDSWESLGL